MALNYERVGWVDTPSTNTPISSGNLNHMDNGILAVSSAYDTVVPALEDEIQTMYGTYNDVLGDFAQVELTNTASKDYSVGDRLVFNSKLYKVIASITEGTEFVEDTNIEQTTVADEMNTLKEEVVGVQEDVSGLQEDLGSPSSASSVTGADAFSKIATLNSNKAENNISGTNYCKMPDGTLIQWGIISVTTGTSTSSLNYYHGYAPVVFTTTFASTPTVVTTPEENAGYWNSSVANLQTTGCNVFLAGSLASTARNVMWTAIGRWK